MGAPKKIRRKYSTPKKPYDRTRLESEKKLKQDFGLRRKKEIWRAEGILRNFRQRARELQARPDAEKEKMLFDGIRKMGVDVARLEDILVIGVEDVLARRLQTVVFKKGLANSPNQARQFIVHGHVTVDGRKAVWPSFIVERGMEDRIMLNAKISAAMVKAQEEKKGKGKK